MGVQLNEDKSWLVNVTLSPSQVSANSTSEQAFAIPNVRMTDFIQVNKPSHTSGFSIGNCRVSAAGVIAITFQNITGSPITPPSESYQIWVERVEKPYASIPA